MCSRMSSQGVGMCNPCESIEGLNSRTLLLTLQKRTCVPGELKLGVRPCAPTYCWLSLEIQQPCPGFVLALTGTHPDAAVWHREGSKNL